MREYAADLAVLAFRQAHLDPGVAPGAALEVSVDRAVVHAIDGHTLGEPLQLCLSHMPERPRAIGADDAGPRKLKLPLQLAVIGEEQKPFRHEVEPADRHQA